MNCVKTLTNGRISLTKPLPFTSHASNSLPLTPKAPISSFPCFQLPFCLSKAQKCPITCFREPISMTKARKPLILCFRRAISMAKAQKYLILCFRLSFYRPKARKCPITCFRLIKDAKFNYRPLHSRLNPIYLPQICADIEYVHKLCRPVWPGYLKPLSNESAPINCH